MRVALAAPTSTGTSQANSALFRPASNICRQARVGHTDLRPQELERSLVGQAGLGLLCDGVTLLSARQH
jgi:hypothetical protein